MIMSWDVSVMKWRRLKSLDGHEGNLPLVTVFLPTFSRVKEGYLSRAIQSVLNQTYPHFELIIIDDASVDGSDSLVQSFAAVDQRVVHVRMPQNTGLPAYNMGMVYPKTHGVFFAFAYDDCVLRPNHLAVLVHHLNKNAAWGMVYGQAELIWSSGKKQTIGLPYNHAQMEQGNNHIPNVSVMVRRTVIENVGWYDPHVLLSRFYDWDLWQRIAAKYPLGYVEEVLAEEYGISLPDSIGNTYTALPQLMLKYSKLKRDAMLKPCRLNAYDPYRCQIGIALTETEQADLIYLILEHYIKTLKISSVVELMKDKHKEAIGKASHLAWRKLSSQNVHIDGTNLLLLMQGLMAYIDRQHRMNLRCIADQMQVIQEKQQTIDGQQSYIDKQQVFINRKEKYIYELHDKLVQLEHKLRLRDE
jgi:glycosyltransferase involved in cell wall biosynthesis